MIYILYNIHWKITSAFRLVAQIVSRIWLGTKRCSQEALGFTGLQIREEVVGAFSWSVTKPVIILSIFLQSYWPGVWKGILRFLMLPQVATLSVFATLLTINIPKTICDLKINKLKLPCELLLGKKACRFCLGGWVNLWSCNCTKDHIKRCKLWYLNQLTGLSAKNARILLTSCSHH